MRIFLASTNNLELGAVQEAVAQRHSHFSSPHLVDCKLALDFGAMPESEPAPRVETIDNIDSGALVQLKNGEILKGALNRLKVAIAILKEREGKDAVNLDESVVISMESGIDSHPGGKRHGGIVCDLPRHAVVYIAAQQGQSRKVIIRMDEGFSYPRELIQTIADKNYKMTIFEAMEQIGLKPDQEHCNEFLGVSKSKKERLTEGITRALGYLADSKGVVEAQHTVRHNAVRVCLASVSDVKLGAVRQALDELSVEDYTIQGKEVESGVRKSPVGLEVMQGALTRLENAKKELRNLKNTYIVAIESGFAEHPKHYQDHKGIKCELPCHAIAYIAVEYNGRCHIMEVDEGFDFDREDVIKLANEGFHKTTIGEVMRNKTGSGAHNDPHPLYLGRSRQDVLAEATRVALRRVHHQTQNSVQSKYVVRATSPGVSRSSNVYM